jgi:hypothetical protein
MINGDNPNVKKKIDWFFSDQKNAGKTEETAIRYCIGNFRRTLGELTRHLSLEYIRGTSSYTIFESVEKYFYCKLFKIRNEEKRNEINKILIDLLKTTFSSTNHPKNVSIDEKPCELYVDDKGELYVDDKGVEIFYYNNFYKTQSHLHITIAKIEKTKWEKYNAFNITNEDSKNYFLHVCNNIILNASFGQLCSLRYIYGSSLLGDVNTIEKN